MSPTRLVADQEEGSVAVQDVKPSLSEISQSLNDNVSIPSIVTTSSDTPTKVSLTDGVSVETLIALPPCRFETSGVEQFQCVPSSSSHSTLVNKQRTLERLMQRPNVPGGVGVASLPSNNPGPLPSNNSAPPSISTSTFVTNLANSILVNVLHNNMMEAAAAAAGSTFPPLSQGKQGSVTGDELLMKPVAPNGGGGKELSLTQSSQQHLPIQTTLRGLTQQITRTPSGSVARLSEASLTNGLASSALSFNPNHLLNSQATASYISPKFNSGASGTVYCQPTAAVLRLPCVTNNSNNETQGGPCPKQRRLN